jgi:AraC family transcriptional regulator, transcriptional activator of pobA
MIPIHDLEEHEKKEIKMIELDKALRNDATEPHRHQYYECFVFLKGGGTHVVDFVEFPIVANSIHLVTPGQVHKVKRKLNSTGFVFIFDLLHFNQEKFIEQLLFDHTCFDVNEFSPAYHFDKSFAEELESISTQAWTEFNSNRPFKNQIVLNQLRLLMLYSMRLRGNSSIEGKGKSSGLYSAFRRLMHNEYKSLKRVKDYAAALNITEKTLNEEVLSKCGATVSIVISQYLILEAKRLLNTGVSAKEVAFELNFTDPAHFSKFFKTQTGFSPSEFKNVHE